MPNATSISLASLALTSLALASGEGAAPVRVELQPKPYRSWEVWLPSEQFRDVGGGIPVPHLGGERYSVTVEGDRLRADLDGNGELEALVEGESGFLTFTGVSPEGQPLDYSVRLARRPGKPWTFSCGGSMVGTIGDTRIEFIDQNLNGSFDDYGEDALIVGRDVAASFLSSVVSVGGELYTVDVARDGSSFTYAPYEGESGTLDLVSRFDSKAKLRTAVVVGADGRTSFSLARARSGLRVPAGEYRLHSGQVVLGDALAQVRGGRSEPLHVAANATESVAWGGPVQVEFLYERSGDQIGFTPWDIWYFGQRGEEYSNFLPLGKSPDFIIQDKTTGEALVIARFPGNC